MANNFILLTDPNGMDYFWYSVDGKSDPQWIWHEGSTYDTGKKDNDGRKIILTGVSTIFTKDDSADFNDFDGGSDEQTSANAGYNPYQGGRTASQYSASQGVNTVNNVLGYVGYIQPTTELLRKGMTGLPASHITDMGKYINLYKRIGTFGDIAGAAGNAGMLLDMGLNVQQYSNGEISRTRLDYRLGTTVVVAGTATLVGAIPAAIVGGIGWMGEKSFDGAAWFLNQMSTALGQAEYGLKNGWVPGR